jgi:hypothetical protein
MPQRIPNLGQVSDIARENGSFSESSLRDLIYHAVPRLSARGEQIPPNGFGSCIVRVGRRVLIDREAFATWLERGRVAPISELLQRTA